MTNSASAQSQGKQKRLPLLCKILYAWAALSILLYFLFTKIAPFADWFNNHISPIGRRLMAYLTVWIPFSLAECLLLLLPALAVFLILAAKRSYCDTWHNVGVYLGKLAAVLCAVLILFVWNFAPGYYGYTLDRKLGLDRTQVSADELYQTALLLTEELRQVTDELVFPGEEASSVMPYSYSEMNKKLMKAYDAYTESHAFPDCFHSRVKPVMLSHPMSYTHITGVYSFFTGEANLNVNFPDYTLPYTAAHELAHQRGVAREDEANMIAFLVCLESEDPYIRYSALLNVYEYVASALYSASRELYSTAYSVLPAEVVQEEMAYSRFFDEYRDNVAADISEATNNAYLQSQGATAGTRSYGMVVDLTVAYYRPRFS